MNTRTGTEQSVHQPTPLRVVWAGTEVDPMIPSAPDTTAHSLGEERFDGCQLDAMLHLLQHLTRGLPGFARNWLLRRASALPHLHGHFGPLHGRLGFHAADNTEAIGMSACWGGQPDGTKYRLW